jgi:uncharacterized cupredoxin-like copper-binding protein
LVWDKGVTIPKVVAKKAQTIDFPAIPDALVANKAILISGGITSGGLQVTYAASGACTFDAPSSSILLNKVGSCSVTASQAGNASYLAATSVTRTFQISKAPQSIEAPEIEEQDLSKTSGYTLDFETTGADTPVVITSQSSPICTVDGNAISFLAVGNCMLTFNKAGDDEYEAATQVSTTIKITQSANPGDAANPAGLGVEVTKMDVTVSVDAIIEEVSDAVCKADSANESCIDEDGIGVFDAASETRYVEVVFTISNNSTETWIAFNIGLQVDADHNYEHTMVFGIDSLDELELEPGDSITGSYFVLLPNSDDSAETFIFYGDGTDEGTFYFKAK